MNIGLRFKRTEAPALRNLSTRVKLAELGNAHRVDTFDKAADSAQHGEPLIVACNHPDEAQRMADMFVVLGITRPAVEPLSG